MSEEAGYVDPRAIQNGEEIAKAFAYDTLALSRNAHLDVAEARQSLTLIAEVMEESHSAVEGTIAAQKKSAAELAVLVKHCEALEALYARIDAIDNYIRDVDARTSALEAVCEREVTPAPLAKLKGLFNRFTKSDAPAVPAHSVPIDPDDYRVPNMMAALRGAPALPIVQRAVVLEQK